MSSIAVEANNITKIFSLEKRQGFLKVLKNFNNKSQTRQKLAALDDVSFHVSKGEVLGIIGKNGSGKTTLLRTIAGIYVPDLGNIRINGQLAPLLQIGTGFNDELNAQENVIISGMFFGMSKSTIKEKLNNILEFAEVEDFSKMKLKHFSTGMRARLAFSTAIQMDPDILLVDEILAVGDIGFRKKSFEKFLSFKEAGKTILFTAHNMEAITQVADRVLLLNKGKVEMIGKPDLAIKKYKEIIESSKK